MASTDIRARSGEVLQKSGERWQQSTNQLQKSTTAMWRRSTSVLSDSKDRCHQSTMETYHRSADSWSESKDRCRRTTLEMVNRSTTRLAQSAARLQQMQRQALLTGIKPDAEESPEQPSASTPEVPPSQASEPAQFVRHMEGEQPPPPEYSEFDQASEPQQPQQVQTSPKTHQTEQPPQLREPQQVQPSQSITPPQNSESIASSTTGANKKPRSYSLNVWRNSKHKPKPEEQARAFFESMDQIVAQVVEAKHLRDSKLSELREIERDWVNSTTVNAETAARGLARILQSYRQDMAKNKGKLSSSNRKTWKNKDCLFAEEKHAELLLQHNQLEKVINHLQNDLPPLESPSSTEEPPRSLDEPAIATPTELPEPEAVIVAELPADQQISELDPTSVIAELPSESKAVPFIAELPEDSVIVKNTPSVPKIIVTGVSDSPVGTLESPRRTHISYEIHEINETLKQTRTDTREQQSESLSNIVAQMDTTRARF